MPSKCYVTAWLRTNHLGSKSGLVQVDGPSAHLTKDSGHQYLAPFPRKRSKPTHLIQGTKEAADNILDESSNAYLQQMDTNQLKRLS